MDAIARRRARAGIRGRAPAPGAPDRPRPTTGARGRAALLAALLALLAVASTGCFTLARSAAKGNVAGVKAELAKGESPDSVDIRRRSAIELAIIYKRKPVVDVLIEAGANVNRRGYRTRTPLIWASSRFGWAELVPKLIEAGANPDLPDGLGQTPLFYAVYEGKPEQVQALIDGGADVNKLITPRWKTPVLDIAIRRRNVKAVELLVAAGAEVGPTTGRRRSAQELAGRNPALLAAIDRGLASRGGGQLAQTYARPAPSRPAPPRASIEPQPRRPSSAVAPLAPPPSTASRTSAGIGAGLRIGKYYALVIGNDDYRYLPKLKTAVNDARALSAVLSRHYGYEVTTLYNATRADILKALNRYRTLLRADDNLLIYYAGHGWLDEEEDRGYWLPVDASQTDDVHWIPNGSITSKTRAIEAKHIMVIADSCYSGKLVRGIHVNQKTPSYLKRLATRKARVVLTSGGIEPVSDAGGRDDHSVFASALLEALSRNQDVLEGHELFTLIRRPVAVNSDQIPEYSDIRKAGHDGGDFLFIPQ
jgi:hypothetical protein